MKKTAGVLFLACAMFGCMLASGAHAAPSAVNQAVARNLTASLRADLQIADQQPELGPLVSSTYVLLDALEAALARKDVEAMRFAVEQYADEVQFFEASAFNTKCALLLALSLNNTVLSMLGIVTSGGTPLCIFINLSNTVADLLSSTLSYQVCVIVENSDNATDNATLTALFNKQQACKIFGFTASVMNLVFCKRPLTLSDFESLLYELIGLIP